MGGWFEVKPLDLLLLFLIVALPLIIMNDLQQSIQNRNENTYKRYSDAFQAAVDDTAYYLTLLEAQQTGDNIHYGSAKRLGLDQETIHIFYRNLALKFGIDEGLGNKLDIESNKVEQMNLAMHIPAMVFYRYDGYILVTLGNGTAGSLLPQIWPVRPYTYKLPNGNIIYFTLDDHARMYITPYYQSLTGSPFALVQGSYNELRTYIGSTLPDLNAFRQARQQAIAANIEKDLGGAINRHLELVKQMGLSLQFSLPRELGKQAVQDVGFMAFMQGYPLPGGERLDAFSFSGGGIVRRKPLVGTINGGVREAYPESCVPPAVASTTEVFHDPIEAAKKGYYIRRCD
jgi:hypothetical protein